jgi:hypothetical protein
MKQTTATSQSKLSDIVPIYSPLVVSMVQTGYSARPGEKHPDEYLIRPQPRSADGQTEGESLSAPDAAGTSLKQGSRREVTRSRSCQ